MTYLILDNNGELQDVFDFESDEQLENFLLLNPDCIAKLPGFVEDWESEDDDGFYEN